MRVATLPCEILTAENWRARVHQGTILLKDKLARVLTNGKLQLLWHRHNACSNRFHFLSGLTNIKLIWLKFEAPTTVSWLNVISARRKSFAATAFFFNTKGAYSHSGNFFNKANMNRFLWANQMKIKYYHSAIALKFEDLALWTASLTCSELSLQICQSCDERRDLLYSRLFGVLNDKYVTNLLGLQYQY